MNKEELRGLYRQIRLRMSEAEVSTKSRIIGRKLLNDVDWNAYDNICAYQPIANLNEVDIEGVISRLKAQSKKVYLLSQGRNLDIPAQRFDLIIVPCLAFDKNNYRLGWGGGFYDKFLAAQPKARKIGVCYSNGLAAEGLPRQPHDVALNAVFTD